VIVDRGISRARLRKRARTRWCRSYRAESDRDGKEWQDALAIETRVSTPRRESQESRAWLKGRTHRDQLAVIYLEPLGTSKSRNDRFRPEALWSLAAGRTCGDRDANFSLSWSNSPSPIGQGELQSTPA
jgi:hypothetical protein